ncbi:MAG: enoyl-CoA hydratase/isomerase family protein [Desulfobacterales bacterium]|nr:enoyl-CoA hydratase/isomerase family protein [Desulfobacterales bacterium]
MAEELNILEIKDNIATITFNRPPANAWSLAALEDFEKALDKVENDKNVRVVILTGAGEKCFSAGFDVKDSANQAKTGPKGEELWRRIDRFEKPLIAGINGHAFGGGLELTLCCHFRIMADSPKAQIGQTELNLGIIPGWGGTQRLMREVGRARALEMILFSKRLSAAEALDAGLVHQIVPPEKLMDEVTSFAHKLAERPPVAVGCVLRAMSAGLYEGLDAGLKTEREGSRIAGESKDAAEGFTAFLEKRSPVFKGE